jgi:hypothetical protein
MAPNIWNSRSPAAELVSIFSFRLTRPLLHRSAGADISKYLGGVGLGEAHGLPGDIPVAAFAECASRRQIMTDHARNPRVGIRSASATAAALPLMIEAAPPVAWSTDRGQPLASGPNFALRAERVIFPALEATERAAIAGSDLAARQCRACGPNLVIVAIVCWNSTYLADPVAYLPARETIDGTLLAYTTPLTREHIGLSGTSCRCQQASTRSGPHPPSGLTCGRSESSSFASLI